MIYTSLYTSGSGIQAASGYLDLTSNNIANADTTGYKTIQARFDDYPYVGLLPDGTNPTGTRVGTGAALANPYGLFTQGPLTPTGRPLDLAIQGNGFFAVTLPDGTAGYTRAGNFNLDAAGTLVSSDGFRVAPLVTVPPGATDVTVGANGMVSATTAAGVVQLGTLTLTTFPNPAGLARVGQSTLVATPASGAGTATDPGTGGAGTIAGGNLEGSNVNLPTELVNLIIAQQAFAVNTQAFQVEDQTIQATNDLIT